MENIYTVKIPDGTSYDIRLNDDMTLPLMDIALYHKLLEQNPLIKTEIIRGVKPLVYEGKVVTNIGDGVTDTGLAKRQYRDDKGLFYYRNILGHDKFFGDIILIKTSGIRINQFYLYNTIYFGENNAYIYNLYNDPLIQGNLHDSNLGRGSIYKVPNIDNLYMGVYNRYRDEFLPVKPLSSPDSKEFQYLVTSINLFPIGNDTGRLKTRLYVKFIRGETVTILKFIYFPSRIEHGKYTYYGNVLIDNIRSGTFRNGDIMPEDTIPDNVGVAVSILMIEILGYVEK